MTHSPSLREARIDFGVSILSSETVMYWFRELRSIMGLQWFPGFGTKKSQLQKLRLSSLLTFSMAFLESRSRIKVDKALSLSTLLYTLIMQLWMVSEG